MRQRLLFGGLFARNKDPKERRKRQRFVPPPGTTILVVDDSRTVVHALRTMLRQAGYTTIEAGDAETGITLAREHRPNLILLDVVLPGMNGFQATRVLNKDPLTANIPIIVMSGNQQATERFWVLKIGASDFMIKPFERGALFEKIEQHVLRHVEA